MAIRPASRLRLGPRRAVALSAAALWAAAAFAAALSADPASAADPPADGAASHAADDHGEAARAWRLLAEGGDPTAQFNMGLLLEAGRGAAPDPRAAAAWYERAARQGLAAAQYNLAVLTLSGRGVAKDDGRALYWLEVAALHGEGPVRARAVAAAGRLAPLLPAESAAAMREAARVFSPRAEPRAAPPDLAPTPALALSAAQIAELQRRLAALGYDPGPADGVAGERTRRAVRRYFADRGRTWPPAAPLTRRLLELVESR